MLKGDSTYVLYKNNIRRTFMKCPLFKNNFLYYLKKKQSLFVDYLTYQRIRSQVFNYPKKYQNGYTYYVDLDNDLY